MNGRLDLSIVIVNWNTRDLLMGCLDALSGSAEGVSYEVIVVDNASTDGSVDRVKRDFPEVRLLPNASNMGFCAGTNQGIRVSSGRYVLLLNSDTEVRAGALAKMVRYMDRHPEVGIAGPKLRSRDGSLQWSCGIPPSILTELFNKMLLHILFPFYKLGWWDHRETRTVGWVSGACLMARRAMLDRIGLLDEGMYMFYDDVELCLRARRTGWHVVYLPSSEVIHVGGQSVQQDFGRMLVISQQSTFYFFQKHYPGLDLCLLRLFTVGEMVLRSLLWGGIGLIRSARRMESRGRVRAYWTILRRSLWDRAYWSPLGKL